MYSAPIVDPTLWALSVFPGEGAAMENLRLSLVMETSGQSKSFLGQLPEQLEPLLGWLLLSQCSRSC